MIFGFLKENLGIQVLGLVSDEEERKRRLRGREREGDGAVDPDRLIEIEKGINQPDHGQQVAQCLAMADLIIENNGTEEELREKVIGKLEKGV